MGLAGLWQLWIIFFNQNGTSWFLVTWSNKKGRALSLARENSAFERAAAHANLSSWHDKRAGHRHTRNLPRSRDRARDAATAKNGTTALPRTTWSRERCLWSSHASPLQTSSTITSHQPTLRYRSITSPKPTMRQTHSAMPPNSTRLTATTAIRIIIGQLAQ